MTKSSFVPDTLTENAHPIPRAGGIVHNGNCILRGRVHGASLSHAPSANLRRTTMRGYAPGHAVYRMLARVYVSEFNFMFFTIPFGITVRHNATAKFYLTLLGFLH